MTEVDPYPRRTPCLFEGCQLSVEEHHRINRGLVAENASLRAKMRQPEVIDLTEIDSRDLLAEVARRLEDSP